MFRIGVALLAIISLGSALGQDPVDQYSRLPTTWAAAISPDGKFLALGCSPRGVQEICVYDLIGDTPPALIPRQPDADIRDFFWASPDHLIYRLAVYRQRVNRFDRYSPYLAWNVHTQNSALLLGDEWVGAAGHIAIASLRPSDDTRIAISTTEYRQSHRYTRLAGTDRRTRLIDVDLDTGRAVEAEEIRRTDGIFLGPDGEIIARRLYDPASHTFSIFTTAAGRRPIFEGRFEFEQPIVVGHDPEAETIILRMPDGAGLHSLPLASEELVPMPERFAHADTINETGGGMIVGFEGWDHLPSQFFTDETLAAALEQAQGALDHRSVVIDSWTSDKNTLVVIGYDFGQPRQFYLLDRSAGQIQQVGGEADQFAGVSQPTTIALDYEARDGLTIPAYLTLPAARDAESGPPPLVVIPHGGPEARDTAAFHYRTAFLASMGYAVFQPNFRGSSGYGQEFVEAGYGEFGGAMITDIVDGVRHLEREGLVGSSGYCAVGSSYGGYAALMLALEDSESVRCAMAISPVTHPLRMNREENVYWENYFGDRFQSDEAIRRFSPMERAEEFRTPLIIVHGESDAQVPIEQSVLLANAMNTNADFRFVALPQANHFFRRQSDRHTMLRLLRDMLDEHHPVPD